MLRRNRRNNSHRGLALCWTWVAWFLLAPGPPAVAEIFWAETSNGKVRRAQDDGSSPQDVATGLSTPLTVTFAGGKLYWVASGSGTIERANPDGSGRELLASGLGLPRGVAVDVTGSRLYWSVVGKIQRANLDGTSPVDLITGIGNPLQIQLDVSGGKIYWTNSSENAVRRANLADGSNVELLVDGTQTSGPFGLALHLGTGKMYWASQGAGPRRIQRADLGGTSVQDIVPSLSDPQGVAIDPGAGKVYWTDQGTGKVQRANLDGTNVEDLLTPGTGLGGIAVSSTSAPVAGAVPDGATVPGTPLRLGKDPGGATVLTWSASCRATDVDYAIYRGALDGPAGQLPLQCTTLGATTTTIDPVVKLFWTEKIPGKVRRSDLDGANPEDVIVGLGDPQGLVVAGDKVYWIDAQFGRIDRANLDGTDLENVATGLSTPRAATVDLRSGLIYWSVADKIERAALDGSNRIDLVTGIGTPIEVEIDVVGQKIYWTDPGQNRVRRANLSDGSNVQTVVDGTQTSGPRGLDIDRRTGKLYWTSQGAVPRRIQRANLDGTNVEQVVLLTDPQSVALDVGARKLYWTDQGTGKIQRANLDGTDIEELHGAVSAPSGIGLAGSAAEYFLVVPHDGTREGSYGLATSGARAVGAVPCRVQAAASCP